MKWSGIIRRYREFLPIERDENIVSLNEGNTPLIESKRLRDYINKDIKIYLKYEGANPTGSFKDRGMTVAVSKALEEGSKAIICASTGNTAASAAAYAARGNLKAYILIPEGKIALGKLSQIILHGAKVIQIKGNFDEALSIVKDIVKKYNITLVNSLNPYRLEGQKTAAFEICDILGFAPTYHSIPVGNAGNITAYWKGYKEYKERGLIDSLPKMLGFQAEGAAPIVRGHPIENPETIATAIRIGNPANWKGAERARDESQGIIEMVSDEEILNAYRLLAKLEGIFVEPASAASIAGIIKLNNRFFFNKDDVIVCTLTGHGLKDPNMAIEVSEKAITLPADMDAIVEAFNIL